MSDPEHGEKDAEREATVRDEAAGAAAGEAGAGAAATDDAAPVPDDAAATRDDAAPTEELGHAGEVERTLERPAADATAPRPAPQDAPGLRDVGGTLGGYLRGRVAVLKGLVARHRAAAAALALIAVAAVALLAVALSRALAVPDAATVQADARALLSAPDYSGGTYGSDTTLVLQDVDVRAVSRSQTAPEGTSPAFGASGYATAQVVASYTGQSVRADRGATLGYAQVGGQWSVLSDVLDGGVSWHATGGVDQQKVLRNVHLLLERADDGAEGVTPLTELYAGCAAAVEEETFDEDAQTDTLVIACERDEGFSSYACRLTVVFSFSQVSGQWEVSEASADDAARERDLTGLVGTWEGTFQTQGTDGAKCLAGRSQGLRVVISGAGSSGGVATLTGTLSGVAHFHAHPRQDSEASEGDVTFSDEPFTARLVEGEGPGLRFDATLPEDVGGTVSLTLSFGAEDDPGRAEALVTTSFPHTETILFIPYETTTSYEDTFSLAKL